jgi:hypothetical protein
MKIGDIVLRKLFSKYNDILESSLLGMFWTFKFWIYDFDHQLYYSIAVLAQF